jgi:hypothetical protein
MLPHVLCEMYRNLLLAGFDNTQRYNTIKCQQCMLLERCLLKILHVSVWATIFEVETSTDWLFLMCNIKCFVCNYISAVQLFMIRCAIVFLMVHHKGLLKVGWILTHFVSWESIKFLFVGFRGSTNYA